MISENTLQPQWAHRVAVLDCAAMSWKWATLRSGFIAARGDQPQAVVAERAGLHQSAISKLENNDNLGPAVEVFLNAIEGLGLKPSAFFLQLESGSSQTPKKEQNSVLHSGPSPVTVSADTPQTERDHGRRRSVDLSGISPDIRRALRTVLTGIVATLAESEVADATHARPPARAKQSRRR